MAQNDRKVNRFKYDFTVSIVKEKGGSLLQTNFSSREERGEMGN
jgi:hypothetical protein